MITDYQRQQKIFSDFTEETQDRFDAIIKDGVLVVFDVNSITFDQKFMIKFSFKKLIPELLIIEPVATKEDIEILRNILNNFDEISDYLKQYVTMFNHLKDFTDTTEDSEVTEKLRSNIESMIENNQIDNQKFFIKTETEGDNTVDFYLIVENYGSSRKFDVDMAYYVNSSVAGSSTIGHYRISKDQFIGDVVTQLVKCKCTHL